MLYDIHAHFLFVSRHVVFQENIFLFKTMQASSNPIFAVLELVLLGTEFSPISFDIVSPTAT